jgi:prevent-host-death family protein
MHALTKEDAVTATVTTKDLRTRQDEILRRVAIGRERAIVTKNGKDLVAIIPMEEYRILLEVIDDVDGKDGLGCQ